MKLASHRLVALGLAVTATLALGAAQNTQTIDAGGLKFPVPEAWKVYPPKNQMRAANLTIPAAEGDKESAELVVSAFPGGAGSVDANVARWEQQFQGANGQPAKAESKKTMKVKSGEATRIEVAGTFVEPTFGRGNPVPKSGYRLLGAIIETGSGAYYLKLTGPEKTVKAATPAFDKLVAEATATK